MRHNVCPGCDPYELVCRALRLANHALRGVNLALGELPPGVCDEAGVKMADAEDKIRRAIRALEEVRGPFDAHGEPVAPTTKA